MNSKNIISRTNYSLPKYLSCKECCYAQTCPRFDKCDFLLQQDHIDDEVDSKRISEIKAATFPLPYEKFRLGHKGKNTSSDDIEPIYTYYRAQVNEAIDLIRKGGTAYAYTERALKDILKFVHSANVSRQDGIYYIRIII